MQTSTVEGVPTDVLERIQKIFSLAAKNPNEAEAAAAVAKGQELLERYNLSHEAVMGTNAGSGARERVAVNGGMYQYQRDLWGAVADINFCWYWPGRYWASGGSRWGGAWKHNHNLIGRRVNVTATQAMATYLEAVATRITKEHTRGINSTYSLGNWAHSFKRGLVDRICRKLWDRRRAEVEAESAREAAARKLAAEGASTATALTISVYHSAEMDANYDMEFGEGWSARKASERAEKAARQRAWNEARTRWAAAFPEEARAADARYREQKWRGGGRRDTSRDNLDGGAYSMGYAAGAEVSIDQQVDGAARGRIGHD
jgi:hypothetical protein